MPQAVRWSSCSQIRGGIHCPSWKLAVQEEIEWIAAWPYAMWGNLNDRVLHGQGMTARVLLDHTLQAAHVIAAFLQQEVFYLQECPPWSLLFGDIPANVRALREGEDATEAVTWKIQQLARQGSNLYELHTGLRLLREASWCTTTTEQQHASVKMVQRHHPDYFLNQLVVRAALHSFRRLLPEPSPEQKLIARLGHKLGRLVRKQGARSQVG